MKDLCLVMAWHGTIQFEEKKYYKKKINVYSMLIILHYFNYNKILKFVTKGSYVLYWMIWANDNILIINKNNISATI